MHFGEYELSPCLIGLSLLPSAHPEAFQRLSVRPSRRRYPSFSLAKGRSHGFASAPGDYAPSSDSLSLRLPASTRLTSPPTATRRLIMGVLFTFPSRYLSTIGLRVVFSLAGWSRLLRTGFLVSRPTQVTPRSGSRFPYGALTPCGPPFHAVPVASAVCFPGAPTTPRRASTPAVWAAPLSLAATRGITVVFFSCGYWDVSVPRVGPAATAAVRGSRRVGSPIRTPPDLRPFAPPRGFSQPVASFFAPRSQGIRRTPLILSFWLSFILSLCSLPLLLFAVFLLPPCQ